MELTPIHTGYAAHLLNVPLCQLQKLNATKLGLSKEVVEAISEAMDLYSSMVLDKATVIMDSLPAKCRFPQGPHIYILIERNEIKYVGQTVCLKARIEHHIYKSRKTFDSVYIQPCEEDGLIILEALYIHKLKPVLNQLKATRITMIEKIHSALSSYLI